MSDLPTHAARWQHRTHADVTRHWGPPGDLTPHPGDVQACETCNPKETRDAD